MKGHRYAPHTTRPFASHQPVVGARVVVYALLTVAAAGTAYMVSLLFPYPAQITSIPPPPPPVMITIGTSKPFRALKQDYTRDTSIWKLVNKQHPLADPNYQPAHLIEVPVMFRQDLSSEERSIRSDVAPHLKDMFDAAARNNTPLMIGSAFRSATLQKFYFDNYVRNEGLAKAQQFSALPGQSEHQTGLAIDISTLDHTCYLSECFIRQPEGEWLANHAHEFGFILRYAAGKEAITGYHPEAWHYRYVGKELAAALQANGLAFEEVQPQLHSARETLRARGYISAP